MLFSLLGLMLVGYGLVSDRSIYERSLGYNVNLVWGFFLLAFGLICLYLGRSGTSSARLAAEDPEGRATEELERRTGLESG
jgi:hypothetical protein